MYESKKQARKKQTNRQRHKDSNLHRVSKASDESVSQTPAGLSEGHLASAAALGLCWLVLACLARAALFRRACAWKNFSGPKKIPPCLLCNPIPRQNELSIPGMVEYLALSSVWKACTWKKTFRALCFFPPGLLCNLIPRQNKLLSPGMVEYMAYSSVWNACTWTKKIGA